MVFSSVIRYSDAFVLPAPEAPVINSMKNEFKSFNWKLEFRSY